MELREYGRACRRRWAWLVVPMLLAVGVAALLALTGPPQYRSSMLLYVTTDAGDPDTRASRLNSYIALLTGPRVAEGVITETNLPLSTGEVQERLTAQVQEGTDLLVVSATDRSATRSHQIVTTATSVLVGLAGQLDAPSTADDAPAPSVRIAQDPVTVRDTGNPVRTIGFSAALGLLIGAAAVAVRQATRRTVTDEEDLRRLGAPAVGVISLGGGPGGHPDAGLAEAFRRLRTLLPDLAHRTGDTSRSGDGPGRSVLFTSAAANEGTTAVACGLAIAIAETGSTVVLVDANMRTPGVGRYLSLSPGPGLADVLAGRATVTDALQDPLAGRLAVLPSGDPPPDPGELLAAPALRATVRALTERFDVVLLDAPPVHAVADAVVLSTVTDGVLLVVRANHTPAADVERAKDLLDRVDARLAGAVLNALPRKFPAGPAWRRDSEVPGSAERALVADLLGDDAARDDDTDAGTAADPADGAGEHVVGRARVVPPPATDETGTRDSAAARGRARVVGANDGAPAANGRAAPQNGSATRRLTIQGALPGPRTPDETRRDGE